MRKLGHFIFHLDNFSIQLNILSYLDNLKLSVNHTHDISTSNVKNYFFAMQLSAYVKKNLFFDNVIKYI